MANNIFQVKRTSTSGRTPNTTGSYATNSQYIAAGEFALNMTDGILYTSNGSAVIEIGANNTTARITSSLTINNDKNLRFQTVNTSAAVSFIQQSDDNFVFYTTNTAYGQRPVWSIYANSLTSPLSFSTPVNFNSNVGVLVANGTTGSAGQLLASNGSTVYWVSPGAASVNTAAQFGWSNIHTFSANVLFNGNGIGIASNTGAIYLGGITDANWKIARNAGVVTKWRYTNNSIDIVTANSNLEGFSIGLVNGNSYFETGYLGTYIASNVTIGNSSVNATINSTTFSATANNASFLGGVAAASYVNTSGVYTITGVHYHAANLVVNNAVITAGDNTNLTLTTSNSSAGGIIIFPNENGVLISGNSSTNTVIINPNGNFVISNSSANTFTVNSVGGVVFSSAITAANGTTIGSHFFNTAGTGVEINNGGTGDRNAFIDFHSDDTYTDYSFRVIASSGNNGARSIISRGTGNLNITTTDAANIVFNTGSAARATLTSAGAFVLNSNTLNLGTSSIAANGYSRLPNGLLLQWGNDSKTVNSSVSNSTTFPVAFTTLYSVTATSANPGFAVGNTAIAISALGTTTFSWRNVGGGAAASASIYYFAIGV